MSDVSCFHNLKSGGIERQLAPGVSARVFPGVHAMLSVVTLEPGAVSPVHAHPNEQWGVCLEGEWIRLQDGVEHHVKAGDFWQTPPNVPHGGRALGVRIFDDFSSGSMANLPFAAGAGERLEIVRGDVRDLAAVERVVRGASVIFHQAAMRSVPRSVADPLGANDHNVNGTLHVLEAA